MELFKVIKPGFLVSLQDAGRPGYRQYGLAISGVMDEASYAWGNFLLGNPTQACSLEITLGQCQLVALARCQIVVTGADLTFSINKHIAPRYQVIEIQPGDILNWSNPVQGVRAYLAVKDGFQGNVWYGSRSVSLREGLGQALDVNQILSGNIQNRYVDTISRFPQSALPVYQPNRLTLYMLPSDQFADFSAASRRALQQQTFRLSSDSNRIGFRLQAEQAIQTPYSNMISEGMLPGSIQIPPDGRPIIMMKEAPTIGGYPKVGTLFNTELNKLAQAMPGQNIRFEFENLTGCQNRQRRAYQRYYPYRPQQTTLFALTSCIHRLRRTQSSACFGKQRTK